MPPGASPTSRAPAPPQPGKKLVGKALIDAVGDILNGRSPKDIHDGEDDQEDDDSGGDDHGAVGVDDEHQGDEGGADDEADADGGDGGEHEDTSIEDVAKALKLSAKDLNKVVMTIEGKRVTLGELKASYGRLAKFDDERAEFDDRANATELEQIDAHRRIMAIIDAFPGNSLPPAVLQRVNQQHADMQRREASLLTKARPQWGDPKYVERERGLMLNVARKYGFSPAELGATVDHRHILLLQDFTHALARIDAAKGAARKVDLTGDKTLQPESQRAANGGRGAAGVGVTKKSQLARRVADLIAKGS